MDDGEMTAQDHVATASMMGRLWMILGAAVAGIPQILDLLNVLPPQLTQTKYAQIALAVLGGLMLIIGNVKSTAARVAAINGEFLVKAATAKAASTPTLADALDMKP